MASCNAAARIRAVMSDGPARRVGHHDLDRAIGIGGKRRTHPQHRRREDAGCKRGGLS